ncbi:hypothetical protein [Salibacterium lacus]|uniref:DUF3102 domain-containing protein n=1 Tax=Salibacterium lacus TaxID=1898109 RepID=A0ABW5SY76_9BACI
MSELSTEFSYEELDRTTADFLRTKETNMREIVGQAETKVGRELKEAQDNLSGSRYDGVFVKWIKFIGMAPQQAYRLIRRYTALTNCENGDQRELLENLPLSLSYEVTGPSAESTPEKAAAKQAVLDGDITTRKEYIELLREKEAEEERAKGAEEQRQQAEQAAEQARQRAEQTEGEAASLRDQLETAQNGGEQPYGVKLAEEIYEALDEMSEWQKKYSWLLTDLTEFQMLVEANPDFAREFNRLDEFWRQLASAFHRTESKGVYRESGSAGGGDIIEGEFSEIN